MCRFSPHDRARRLDLVEALLSLFPLLSGMTTLGSPLGSDFAHSSQPSQPLAGKFPLSPWDLSRASPPSPMANINSACPVCDGAASKKCTRCKRIKYWWVVWFTCQQWLHCLSSFSAHTRLCCEGSFCMFRISVLLAQRSMSCNPTKQHLSRPGFAMVLQPHGP